MAGGETVRSFGLRLLNRVHNLICSRESAGSQLFPVTRSVCAMSNPCCSATGHIRGAEKSSLTSNAVSSQCPSACLLPCWSVITSPLLELTSSSQRNALVEVSHLFVAENNGSEHQAVRCGEFVAIARPPPEKKSQNWYRNGRLGPARRVVGLSAVFVLGLLPTLARLCRQLRLQVGFCHIYHAAQPGVVWCGVVRCVCAACVCACCCVM